MVCEGGRYERPTPWLPALVVPVTQGTTHVRERQPILPNAPGGQRSLCRRPGLRSVLLTGHRLVAPELLTPPIPLTCLSTVFTREVFEDGSGGCEALHYERHPTSNPRTTVWLPIRACGSPQGGTRGDRAAGDQRLLEG